MFALAAALRGFRSAGLIVSEPTTTPESKTPPESEHSSPWKPLAAEFADISERLCRLAQTPGIIGACLIHNEKVIFGSVSDGSSELEIARALEHLVYVGHRGEQIEALFGERRLVISPLGTPAPASGFQVGILVRQGSLVNKSLRRLLRQIDRAFGRQQAKVARLWLVKVYRLRGEDLRARAIDCVLNRLDDLLLEGRFFDVNVVLSEVDVLRLEAPVLLAFLSATKAAKTELPSRPKLLERIQKRLTDTLPDRSENLLRALR